MQAQRNDTRTWVKIARGLWQQEGTDRYRSIVYQDGRGHAIHFEARNKTEARQRHEARRVNIRSGAEVFGNSGVTVAELWQDFESMFRGLVASGERGPRTLERYETQYRSHIDPYFGAKHVQKVSPQQVSGWLVQLRASGLTDITSIYAVLSTLMSFALERGLISKSPCAGISKRERPKQTQKNPPRRIGDDEVSSLLKHALPATRDLLAFYAFTGVRQSEGLGIVWGDIDLEAGTVRVHRQLARKKRDELAHHVPLKTARRANGCREREIELLPSLVALLRRRKAEAFAVGRARPEDFIFATESGGPMYYRNVSRDLGTAADRAGLNGEARERAAKLPRRKRKRMETDRPLLTTHDLRHSAISRWIAAGIDPVTVARWAGDDLQTILSTYAGDFELAKRRDEQRRLLALGTAITIAP